MFFVRVLLCLAVLVPACTERHPSPDVPVPGDAGPTGCTPGAPAYCRGNEEVVCNADGTEGAHRDCVLGGGVCAPGLGCRACVPGRSSCDGNDVVTCNDTGSGTTVVATCDPALGESCDPLGGRCASPCAAAAASHSYVGCEYWAIPTINNGVSREDFLFTLVVSNAEAAPAEVVVTRAGAEVARRTVAAGGTEAIAVPWILALQPASRGAEESRIVPSGAYRVRSTLPVTVYQFNPFEVYIPRDCADEGGAGLDGECYSRSSDASILLPTHVLTGNYLVSSYPTQYLVQTPDGGSSLSVRSPGFVAIAAVAEGRTSIEVTLSSATLAARDGSVRSYAAGEHATFVLDQGDVVQLLSAAPRDCVPIGSDRVGTTTIEYCEAADFDLTGTDIRSSQPLSVIGGHACTFVPSNRWGCDHLEETMFPLESWGDEALVAVTRSLGGEPNVIRVVSSHDANTVTFEPASVHDPVTLMRGEILELEARESFRVSGTDALSVAQLLVGQNYAGVDVPGTEVGDPSLSLAIPIEQFRSEYAFLAPSTYPQSWVNVTAPMDATVTLDGTPVTGLTAIGTTGFGATSVMIGGGLHRISSTAPAGITVYGLAPFTSYMVPGGLDLEPIDVPF